MCKVFGIPALRNKAHFCAISSTSGTATEVTAFSIITDYEKGIKYPIADFEITPDVAIVDPDLAETMPQKLVAHTGMDAMTHAIEVRGDAGYRAGIHMKQYRDHIPVLVIGGKAGSFLGEYQAGGVIVVLGKGCEGKQPTGFFCGTGMHGGRMFLRCDEDPDIPVQIKAEVATDEDKASIRSFVQEYCDNFGGNADEILKEKFYVLTPNSNSPYKRMYTFN